MNKCIYLKETDTTQTFEKQEHIFPAGIGGIKKLPKGYVCDEVNGVIFSKMELDFMRNSPIGLCREFEGPGKRGSFSEKKATKSNVSIATSDSGSQELAYLKKGKPYSLNQIQVSVMDNKINLIMDNSDEFTEVKLDEFINRLEWLLEKGLKGRHILYVEDKSIESSMVFIGELDSKWYIGIKNKVINENDILDIIKKAIPYLKKKEMEVNVQSSQILFGQKMTFNTSNFFRVTAKVAFNYLADRIGQEEALKSDFDELRQFVLDKSDNYAASFIDRKIVYKRFKLPERCHTIAISKMDERLVATVGFYGESFNVGIVLSKKYHGNINRFIGVCDWKNKYEYDLL